MWKNDQVSRKETEKIVALAKESLEVEGDFVEMGCYKGDTSLVLAETLRNHNNEVVKKSVEKLGESCGDDVDKCDKNNMRKKLWIYDSFEGLPEKSAKDKSVLGEDFKKGELFVTKREVKERFLRAGLPVPIIKKAWFSDLTEVDLPSKIAFAFLDGDFYESILDSMRLVEPKMSMGGVMVIHDYSNSALPGVRKAVDEWSCGREMVYRLVLL